MNHVLYIGIYSDGSTSKMRAEILQNILSSWKMDIINTNIPKLEMSHIWQSIGFRYKIGPLISKINRYILANFKRMHYDLIWVDKAIYLTNETTRLLREHTSKLVHYTPDPAFTFHRSRLFYSSLPLYDYAITTKSFEIEDFIRVIGSSDKVLYATQGFDRNLHRPVIAWENKMGVAFIGHRESDRQEMIKAMLQNELYVTLAGIGWDKFVKKHSSKYLNYLGPGVYGEDYVKAISGCLYALGSVSKWIPEKHTTRTFEIPACKTALLTERNSEIEGFYTEDEVIYYNDTTDLIRKIKYYDNHLDELKTLVENGYKKVQAGGFDYESIMKNLLRKMDIIA